MAGAGSRSLNPDSNLKKTPGPAIALDSIAGDSITGDSLLVLRLVGFFVWLDSARRIILSHAPDRLPLTVSADVGRLAFVVMMMVFGVIALKVMMLMLVSMTVIAVMVFMLAGVTVITMMMLVLIAMTVVTVMMFVLVDVAVITMMMLMFRRMWLVRRVIGRGSPSSQAQAGHQCHQAYYLF